MTTTITGTGGVSQVQDGSIGTADLAPGAVTPAKVSGMVVTQANQTPLPGVATLLSFAHGLGVVPISAELELVCLAADVGYSVGDVVQPQTSGSAAYAHGFTVSKSATHVEARVGNTAAFYLVHKTSGAMGGPSSSAKWAWRFKVRAA